MGTATMSSARALGGSTGGAAEHDGHVAGLRRGWRARLAERRLGAAADRAGLGRPAGAAAGVGRDRHDVGSTPRAARRPAGTPTSRRSATAAERERELVHDGRRPPLPLVAGLRAAERVDDVVGLGDALLGIARVPAVHEDGVAAGEVLLEPQLPRDLAVDALDHGAVARAEQLLEGLGPDEPAIEGDAVPAEQGLVEVVEVGAALLVVLEGAQRGAVGDDAVAEAREHRARRQRAVGALERAAVELRDRLDAREARWIAHHGRRRRAGPAQERGGSRVEVHGGRAGQRDRRAPGAGGGAGSSLKPTTGPGPAGVSTLASRYSGARPADETGERSLMRATTRLAPTAPTTSAPAKTPILARIEVAGLMSRQRPGVDVRRRCSVACRRTGRWSSRRR